MILTEGLPTCSSSTCRFSLLHLWVDPKIQGSSPKVCLHVPLEHADFLHFSHASREGGMGPTQETPSSSTPPPSPLTHAVRAMPIACASNLRLPKHTQACAQVKKKPWFFQNPGFFWGAYVATVFKTSPHGVFRGKIAPTSALLTSSTHARTHFCYVKYPHILQCATL